MICMAVSLIVLFELIYNASLITYSHQVGVKRKNIKEEMKEHFQLRSV